MPIYTYKCPGCQRQFDHFCKIAEMRQQEPCECGRLADKILVPAMAQPDLPGYECPITGEWIDGRRAHKENLKKRGCRVLEPGERQEFIKRQSDRQKDFDKRTEQIVEKAARGMGLIR